MQLKFFATTLLALTFSLEICAASSPFKIEKPAKWKEFKQMFGVPYSLVGPKIKESRRPVITVTPAAHSKFPADFFTQGKYVDSFKENKKEWLRDANGNLIRFYHDPSPEMKHIKRAYMTGVSYILNERSFLERSYYFSCQDAFYLVKYLLPLSVKKQFEGEMERVVRGFRCQQ